MAQRKIAAFNSDAQRVVVYRDSDLSEFVCKLYVPGSYVRGADYFTSDKADAIATARAMCGLAPV